jgi:hypothetical protein
MSDTYFEYIANFDVLLCEELYALKRQLGYYWFGRIEITDLETKHYNERENFLMIIKNKYNIDDYTNSIIWDYIKTDISDRNKIEKKYTNNNFNKFIIIHKETIISIERKIGMLPYFDTVYNELNKYRDMITIINFIKNIKKSDTIECCICYDTNSDCITSCKHLFHHSCLSIWIENNNSCPLCRSECIRIYDIDN